MADEPDNLTSVYLRRMDAITRVDERIGDLTLRVNDVQASIAGLRRDQAQDAGVVAPMQAQADRLRDEIERIKRRLDICLRPSRSRDPRRNSYPSWPVLLPTMTPRMPEVPQR